jgi:hypothetical protein
MLDTPFKPLLLICALFVIFAMSYLPASISTASSERLRARNLFATAQNPSGFNKFLDSI